jgi:stage V sporulation protein G
VTPAKAGGVEPGSALVGARLRAYLTFLNGRLTENNRDSQSATNVWDRRLVTGINDTESDSELVTFSVTNARAISGKSLFALVDVEMQIAGVSFTILGVQARNAPNGSTSVHLPTYRDTDGAWRSSIRLPDELREPLGDAVLEFLVEEGLARRKYDAAAAAGRY